MRALGTFAFVLAGVACGPQQEPSHATAPGPLPTSSARAAKEKLGPYYMITARRSVAADDSTPNLRYAILDGVRLVTQHGKLERALTVAEPPLQQVARIPEHLGAGYLFWNQRALYRAQTFTGSLVGLTDLGVKPARVSFGPSFALIKTEHGFYTIDPKSGASKASGISGLIDVASLPDGRSLALTSIGDALVSRDAGKRWTSVRDRLKAPVYELREQQGDLWLIERGGESLRYDTKGELTRHPTPKSTPSPVHSDKRWTLPLTPLEAAAESGLRHDDDHALVAVNGSVVTMDLQSGQLLSFGRALLPSASDCRLLRTSAELLMFCAQPRASIVRDPLGAAVIERSFPSGTQAAFADGALVLGAGCDGELEPGKVCVRSPGGEYRAFDRRIELKGLAEAGKAADIAVEWLPKRGGGAVGVVSRPHAAIVDAASGRIVPIAKERASEWLSAVASPERGRLTSSRVATADGKIIGYGRERSFVVGADGQLVTGAFEFSTVQSFAGQALAVDRSQRYFESSDFGLSWSEVDKAPGLGAPTACSEVGCRSDNWLRFGWGPLAPGMPAPTVTVPAPGLREGAKLPRLDCQEDQAQSLSTKRLSAPVASDETTYDFAFGARQVLMSRGAATHYRQVSSAPGDDGVGLWALVYARAPAVVDSDSGPVPASTAELAREKSVQFVRPFDAEAKVSSGKLSWKEQAAAAIRIGGSFPNLQISDGEQQQALAVAAAPPLFSDGLLLKEEYGPGIWLGAKKPRPISLGQGREDFELRDAASHGGELVLLLIDEATQSQVISLGGKHVRKAFEFPAAASALALGPKGEPALFFSSVGSDPPSEQEPALLVQKGAAPLELPPWSTLKPATAPECAADPSDHRVLIRTPRSWLDLTLASNPLSVADVDGEMLALVRVSATRFCLEAVELVGAEVQSGDITIPTRVVARFSGGASAARVGITLGAEFRQSLSCELH
ncbi:MAG TPA: hypothetical protein VM686_07980 [Polyangiaceae bacterium]|nr:hypothetical protein [Polyangiaceae bacterium]